MTADRSRANQGRTASAVTARPAVHNGGALHVLAANRTAGLSDAALGAAMGCPVPIGYRRLADAFSFVERHYLNQQIRESFGTYLDSAFLFTHFTTLTLRRHHSDGQAVRAGRVRLESAWRYYVAAVRQVIRCQPAGIRVTEFHADGTPHIHALHVNTAGIVGAEREIQEVMWRQYGRARIERPNYTDKAAGYLAKYISKDARVEISAHGRLDHYAAPPGRQPSGHAVDQAFR